MYRHGLISATVLVLIMIAEILPVTPCAADASISLIDGRPLISRAPSISSFTPTQGALGSTVTITGSGFTGATSVTFGNEPAKFTVISNTKIEATVPTLAATGKLRVVHGSSLATSASVFTVLPGVSLSPTAGPPTSEIKASGSGFGPNELVDIYEMATDVMLAVTDDQGRFSGIPLTVPSWTLPGALWISAVGRHSQKAAQKQFAVRTEWSDPRRNAAGSGWNPYENVLDPVSVRRLEMAWTTAGANFLSNGPPGVIVDSNLVVTHLPVHSLVVALRTDGTQAWSQPLNTSFFSGPAPASGSGIVVVPSTDGKLHAYSLSNGAPKWTSPGPNDTGNGAAVVQASLVFAPGSTTLQAFDLKTGVSHWSYTGPCTGNLSTPAISAGSILFTCTNSSGNPVLVSLGTDGTFYHWFSTAAGATSAPAVAGGSGYVLVGGSLVAYSLSAFNPKWNVVPPFAVSTDPAVGDGIVATCGSGGLWVVNITDGTTRFSNSTYACSAPVTIANGVIYEPRNGDVVMFDEFGNKLGRLGSGGNLGPVSVVDGSVYAADSIAGVDRWTIPTAGSNITLRAAPRPDVRQLHPDWSLKPYK